MGWSARRDGLPLAGRAGQQQGQALIGYVRRRVLSGDQLASLPADVRKLSAEAFGLLGDGLAAYGGQPGE